MQLVGEVRDEEIEETVAVDVAHGDAHVGLGATHRVEREPPCERLLLEPHPASVEPQVVGPPVVGHEQIHEAIAIEIGRHHPQRRARRRRQPRTGSHVVEAHAAGGDGASIAEQARRCPVERLRAAEVTLPPEAVALLRGDVGDVVGHDEVQPSVLVHVAERGRRAPVRVVQAEPAQSRRRRCRCRG